MVLQADRTRPQAPSFRSAIRTCRRPRRTCTWVRQRSRWLPRAA